MERHDQNLEVSHSRATEFSQTPYLQNLKLHTLIFILDACRQDLTTGSRDIFVFVIFFRKKRQALSARFVALLCLEKYCCTTKKVNLRLY